MKDACEQLDMRSRQSAQDSGVCCRRSVVFFSLRCGFTSTLNVAMIEEQGQGRNAMRFE
jgi:hypothetical protein